MIQKMKGVDGVPFKLNSQLEASLGKKKVKKIILQYILWFLQKFTMLRSFFLSI